MKMILILLPQIQRTADIRENLGRHIEFFSVTEARHRLETFPGLLNCPNGITRTMHQRIGHLRVDTR